MNEGWTTFLFYVYVYVTFRFMIYVYVLLNGTPTPFLIGFQLVILNVIVNLSMILIMDKIFFQSKLI